MKISCILMGRRYSSHPKSAHCNGIQPIKVAFGEGLDALIPVLYWPDAVQRGARHAVNGNGAATVTTP